MEALFRSLGFIPNAVGTSGVVTGLFFFKTFVAAMWSLGWSEVRVTAGRTAGLETLHAHPGKMVPW